jgi:hypothetical protein
MHRRVRRVVGRVRNKGLIYLGFLEMAANERASRCAAARARVRCVDDR